MSTVKGATTVTYVRDATDRIVERKLNGTTTARYGSTGSGDAPEFTTNASNVLQEVTYALPGGAMLTTRAAGNVWSYPNTHGDVVAVANQTGTKQGSTTNYDPYGNLITGTLPDNSTANLDYAWLGQPQRPLEHETALQPIIEMGARQYSPLLGRFAEVDPIEGGTTTNDYGYVPDPVNQFDLSGEGINQCDVLMLVSQGRGNGKNLTKKQKLSMFIRAQNCYKKTADGVKNRRGRVCKNGYFQSGIIVIGGFGGVLGKITAVSTGVVCKSDQEIRHWK
jgi:RHS repeat-associated protein